MTFEEKLQEYAKVAIKIGVRLRKGQKLQITCPIECVEFGRVLAKQGYDAGASDVIMDFHDEVSNLIRYENAPDSAFETYPNYNVVKSNELLDEDVAYIAIAATNPELLKSVDIKRISTWNKVSSTAMTRRRNAFMKNENKWLVVTAPTKVIAKKIFPNATDDEAVQLQWEAIFKAVRVDNGDGVANWEQHIQNLKKYVNFLNDNKFKTLHYTTKDGSTDLTIELPEEHIWAGGGDTTTKDEYFCANLPTEEVYTMPHRNKVNGIVKNSKPFNYNGNLIDGFTLTFKDGKIIDFTAETGYDVLKEMLAMDDGASYLGEVALVPNDSPISNSNLTYFNTLFDENASCHLAFGKAYPTNLINGSSMTDKQLEEKGANMSLIHEDFMIGSPDLDILGTTYDGKEIQIFKNGNFTF